MKEAGRNLFMMDFLFEPHKLSQFQQPSSTNAMVLSVHNLLHELHSIVQGQRSAYWNLSGPTLKQC